MLMLLARQSNSTRSRFSLRFCVSLAVILLLLKYTHRISACTCIGDSVINRLNQADVVFVGEILEMTFPDEPLPGVYTTTRLIRYRVLQYWKGDKTEFIEVGMASNGGECGLSDPEVGELNLIFGKINDDGDVYTDICMGTNTLCSPWDVSPIREFAIEGVDELNPEGPSNEDLLEMCGESIPTPPRMCGPIALPLAALLLLGMAMFRMVPCVGTISSHKNWNEVMLRSDV